MGFPRRESDWRSASLTIQAVAMRTANRIRALTTMNNRAIVEAFEAAGVEFIPENGGAAGVRLRKPAE